MSEGAIQDRGWGHKAMFHSEFLHLGNLADAHLDRIPEGEFKGYARLAAATLKMAFLDAEAEVKINPDRLGYRQQELLVPPRGEGAIDLIDLHCQILGIDSEFLRDTSSSILDLIADRVRTERAKPSAEVICINEARQRRAAAAQDATFVFVPVHSRRRMVGEQLAWIV